MKKILIALAVTATIMACDKKGERCHFTHNRKSKRIQTRETLHTTHQRQQLSGNGQHYH